MAPSKKQRKALSSTRPPLSKTPRSGMSRKTSRSLINRHHNLEKRRAQAIAAGDAVLASQLAGELADLGGLDVYQRASLQGQSLERGGDTSKVLLEWLPTSDIKTVVHADDGTDSQENRLRMLEVGALSTRNAVSLSGCFEMVHIDLNSQEPGIEQQDFMERPSPENDDNKFDVVSLSLVLNFVPDAATRGAMLTRTLAFLRKPRIIYPTEPGLEQRLKNALPALFLVLPRSCVDNSRYFTKTRLEELMGHLGYTLARSKMTQKLAYSLWKKDEGADGTQPDAFYKREVNPGKTRNNFVITLKGSANG